MGFQLLIHTLVVAFDQYGNATVAERPILRENVLTSMLLIISKFLRMWYEFGMNSTYYMKILKSSILCTFERAVLEISIYA